MSLTDRTQGDREVSTSVFAGTAAEPEVYIDPNFFAWHEFTDIWKLNYTLAVYDPSSDTLLFAEDRSLTWS